MGKKIVFLPYDMDTALGINNEGSLTFGYELEDTDHLSGGANVFNGQDSVLWNNLRDAFGDEIKEMYKTLRSTGALSFDKVEQMFEDHQGKWPEAIFNEDSWFKYILPLIEDGEGTYLPMLQGSKKEQRRWWLYNRFRYIDSKYNAGDALTDYIDVRGYAKSNITVTPYADIYPTVKYGSYLVSERGKRNVATTLVCPLDTLNDTEIQIFSASQLASVGDLSGLKIGRANFAAGMKLQSLKIGDASSSYSNANLTELTLGNNVLLRTLDVRNCTELTQAVDISGCSNIVSVYFDGTKVTGVNLPNGGFLETLHLPSTITNLTIMNQPYISDLVAPTTNLTTLRLENVPTINTLSYLQNTPAGARVRLIGFAWEMQDAEAIEDLYDLLDTMRGLDEQGNTVPTAQMSGSIHTDSLTGAQIAAFKARYPYIDVTADHTTAILSYYNGSTLLTTQTIVDGGDGSYTGSTPTKAQDAQYTYSFSGWSKDYDDNVVDADALLHVVGDRNVYACYNQTLRTYTVTFVRSSDDGGGTLQTINNVAYGTTLTNSSYTGTTPTTTKGSAEDYPFEGWTPAFAPITGNTTYTAKFGSPIEVAEITDSWDQIIAHIDAGDYATRYKIGNYKPLDLGTEGTINMQIVAMDADALTAGGTAPTTFIGMELLSTTHNMNSTDTNTGDWPATGMRSYLLDTIKSKIPSAVASRIQTVNKTYYSYADSTTKTGVDTIWIPSLRELLSDNTSSKESSGVDYTNLFKTNADRKKHRIGVTSYTNYWLRTAHDENATRFRYVSSTGVHSGIVATNSYGVCLGFCLGLEQETITDDWATILANTNYATDYSIGDTKAITINGERHLMQIVAFDTDDKTGGGKAKISWLMKDLMNDKRSMNVPNQYNVWPNIQMRSWLRETVLPTIDYEIRSHIVDVDKIYSGTNISSENLWIPSYPEMVSSSRYAVFTDNTSRIKKRLGESNVYWLRTPYQSTKFYSILEDGSSDSNSVTTYQQGVCIGFCTN